MSSDRNRILPPDQAVRRARAAARQRGPGRSVYLYCKEGAWRIARRMAEVPSGARALQIFADPDRPELGNRGGC